MGDWGGGWGLGGGFGGRAALQPERPVRRASLTKPTKAQPGNKVAEAKNCRNSREVRIRNLLEIFEKIET